MNDSTQAPKPAAQAESIDEMVNALEARLANGVEFAEALRDLLAEEAKAFKRIVFNGDGYSDEWVEEAERRGLLNLRSTLDALPSLVAPKNAELFEKYQVLSRRELESRREILVEQYFMTINIEGETAGDIARTMVLPGANRALAELLLTLQRAEEVGMKVPGIQKVARDMAEKIDALVEASDVLHEQNAELGGDDLESKAEHMRHQIIPAMAAVRDAVDTLEDLVPDDLWPMPTYREMLFIK